MAKKSKLKKSSIIVENLTAFGARTIVSVIENTASKTVKEADTDWRGEAD